MTVIGPELAGDLDKFPPIILRHIDEALRDHHRNPVKRITQAFHQKFQHIKAFPKHLMTELKFRSDLAHDSYLIVFNDFIHR